MDPIERVREGMRVLDATGCCIGTVAEVHFSCRRAATTTGEPPASGSGLLRSKVRNLRTIELPRQRAQLLERIGYFRVDNGGQLGDDSHFSEDDIIAVQRETVHITHRRSRPAA
jgi:hypothetical protein